MRRIATFNRTLLSGLFLSASLLACGGDTKETNTKKLSTSINKQAATKAKVAKTLVKKIQSKTPGTAEHAKVKADKVAAQGVLAQQPSQAANTVPVPNAPLPEQFKGKQVTFATVQEQTQEAIAVAQEFFTQREKEYHGKIEAELSLFNKRIADMQKRATQTAETAKAKVSTELNQLRQQMNVTTTQLVEVNKLSEKEMDQLSGQLRSYIDELQNKTPKPEVSVK